MIGYNRSFTDSVNLTIFVYILKTMYFTTDTEKPDSS